MGRLLAKHGSTLDLAALRDLIAGVIAAPQAEDKTAWVQLVTPTASEALTAQLLALEAAMREVPTVPDAKPLSPGERLEALRAELLRHGLAGFIVPRGDEHQGEYVAPC